MDVFSFHFINIEMGVLGESNVREFVISRSDSYLL
jgi:hypothetical protein